MHLASYAQNISFRWIEPSDVAGRFNHWNRRLQKLGLSLEAYNTQLPVGGREMRRRLRGLLSMPRMSTFAIAAIVNRGVAHMPEGSSFVNMGVWHGYTLLSAMAGNPGKTCIGIDNFSQFGGPREAFLGRFNRRRSDNHFFFEMDYRDYFSSVHEEPIGFYIYDGEHSYENQLEGLRVAEPFFTEKCFVLIDDTNLEAPRKATLDFAQESSRHYEVILDKSTHYNQHPTFWNGVMMLQAG